MNEATRFLGLDVHAEPIAVALAEPGRGEVRSLGMIANEPTAIRKLIQKLGKKHLRVCYEAGPTGFALYCHLVVYGIAIRRARSRSSVRINRARRSQAMASSVTSRTGRASSKPGRHRPRPLPMTHLLWSRGLVRWTAIKCKRGVGGTNVVRAARLHRVEGPGARRFLDRVRFVVMAISLRVVVEDVHLVIGREPRGRHVEPVAGQRCFEVRSTRATRERVIHAREILLPDRVGRAAVEWVSAAFDLIHRIEVGEPILGRGIARTSREQDNDKDTHAWARIPDPCPTPRGRCPRARDGRLSFLRPARHRCQNDWSLKLNSQGHSYRLVAGTSNRASFATPPALGRSIALLLEWALPV